MAKFKKTNVYYYQFDLPTKNLTSKQLKKLKSKFEEAVRFARKNIKEVKQGDGSVMPTKSLKINNRYIGGAIIYTQESNIPPKWDGSKQKLEAIDIAGFRGLGFDAVYLYDTENMILCIESRVPGPSLESFRKLLIQNYNIPSFNFTVVSSSHEFSKFTNSLGVRNVEIKMLNYDSLPTKKADIEGVKQSKEIVDEINGSHITFRVAAGGDKHKLLNFNAIKKMANWAMKSVGFENEVTNFVVDVVDLDSGNLNSIDLMTNRISDVIKIEKEKSVTKFSIKEKIDQVEKHYLRRRPLLDAKFKL